MERVLLQPEKGEQRCVRSGHVRSLGAVRGAAGIVGKSNPCGKKELQEKSTISGVGLSLGLYAGEGRGQPQGNQGPTRDITLGASQSDIAAELRREGACQECPDRIAHPAH